MQLRKTDIIIEFTKTAVPLALSLFIPAVILYANAIV